MATTILIGEYRDGDGWHIETWFGTPHAAREWVDDSGGHHHARRFRRVRLSSYAADVALERAAHEESMPEGLLLAHDRVEG